MTKHTAEPWDLMQHGVIYGGPLQQYANGSSRSQIAMSTGADFMAPGEQQANARRIVACVNACAGIDTGGLEQLPKTSEPIVTRIQRLTVQRNELLGAAREALAVIERIKPVGNGSGTLLRLAAAIDKVTD